jgi:tight adherence protein B
MTILWLVVFLVIFAFVLIGAALGFKFLESQHKGQVSRVLKVIDRAPSLEERPIELLGDAERPPGKASQWLARFRFYAPLQERIRGAGVRWTPEALLGLMLVMAAVGAILGWNFHVFIYQGISVVALSVGLGLAPYFWVVLRRRRRLNAFEQQFPEALEFIARAVRAGHALSVSLELLSSEAPEPIRTEFFYVFHEQNLGADMEQALRNLVRRVPLVDVRFFVSTVLLQRETGGNLAEILMKLAVIIRERFRLKGQIHAATAHGRITAAVLTLMPIALLIGLSIVAPDYLASMARDPTGKQLILFALIGQVLGYLTMYKIVNFKV